MRIHIVSAGLLRGAQIVAGLLLGVPIAVAQQTAPATIVYRVAPVGASVPLAVVAQPRLDLGASGSEPETFAGISFVRRQSTGHIVVVNKGSLQLRVFDSAGRYVRTIGRKGQGPGEYEHISAMVVRPGDSIAVLDRRLRRISLLKPDGSYVSQIPLAPPFAGNIFNTTLNSLGDGTLLIGYAESPPQGASPTPVQVLEQVGRYSAAGKLLNPVGKFLTGEYFAQTAPPTMGGYALWNRAFGRIGAMAAMGNTLVAGDAATMEVRRYTPAGPVQEVHRVVIAARPITAADIDAYKKDALARAQPQGRELQKRRVDEMPYPKTFPAYTRILGDAGGRIWLQLYLHPASAESRWMVLDPATKVARTVRMPARFTPQVITQGEIIGVWLDADGVEHVRAYRLAM